MGRPRNKKTKNERNTSFFKFGFFTNSCFYAEIIVFGYGQGPLSPPWEPWGPPWSPLTAPTWCSWGSWTCTACRRSSCRAQPPFSRRCLKPWRSSGVKSLKVNTSHEPFRYGIRVVDSLTLILNHTTCSLVFLKPTVGRTLARSRAWQVLGSPTLMRKEQ